MAYHIMDNRCRSRPNFSQPLHVNVTPLHTYLVLLVLTSVANLTFVIPSPHAAAHSLVVESRCSRQMGFLALGHIRH